MKLRKFKCLVDEKGMDDIGMSGMTFEVDQLIKDKIYTQADQRNYDKRGRDSAPFFVDDNGCSRNIKEMLRENKIEEVTREETIKEVLK
tara:strand:- start:8740 stop:9006 length:267 start_codon:yes stop_codon:yes gene_type:complete